MKKKICLLILFCGYVFLSGCGAYLREVQRDHEAALEIFQETVPHCEDEQECKEMWTAAQVWVTRNCGMKIQTATDAIIQTYNSVGSSTRLAAIVTKEPLGDGKYRIAISIGCDNIFGCSPNSLTAGIDFNKYVGSFKKNQQREGTEKDSERLEGTK